MESSYHNEIDYERENRIFKEGYDKGHFDALMKGVEENSKFISYLCNLTDEELLQWKAANLKLLTWSKHMKDKLND